MCMHEYFANVMNLHFLWLYREDYVAIACACHGTVQRYLIFINREGTCNSQSQECQSLGGFTEKCLTLFVVSRNHTCTDSENRVTINSIQGVFLN